MSLGKGIFKAPPGPHACPLKFGKQNGWSDLQTEAERSKWAQYISQAYDRPSVHSRTVLSSECVKSKEVRLFDTS